MILRGWHIDAFGSWRDHRVEELSEGLNVFYGPNEIGKSTLHAFVRGVLYGFPDARRKEPLHLPVGGGQRSGRLFVSRDDGMRLTIERSGTTRLRLVDEAGAQIPSSNLDAMLRGTDREVFRNVFAFGLEELASLEGLDPDELGLRIFDAGLEGAGQSVTALVGELRARREAELKPRSGTIRELAHALRTARGELEEAQRVTRGHGTLAAEEARAAEELDRLRLLLEEDRRRLRQKELLLRLWPVEVRRRQALQAWEGAPVHDAPAVAARLQALVADRRLYEERMREIGELQERIGADEAGLASALRTFGADEVALRTIDRSDERRRTIQLHQRRIEAAQALLQDHERERDRLAREAGALQVEVESFAVMADLPVDREGEGDAAEWQALQREQIALEELRAALAAHEEARRLHARLHAPATGHRTLPAAIVGVLFVVVAVGALLLQEPVAAVVAFVAAALAGWHVARSRSTAPSTTAEAELQEAAARVAQAAAALGLHAPADTAAVASCEVALQARKTAWQRRSERQVQLEALRARHAGLLEGLRMAERRVDEAASECAAAEAEWRAHARDLGDDVDCPGALDRLQRAAHLIDRLDALRRDRERLLALLEAARTWEEQVATLLREAGIDQEGAEGLHLLQARLENGRTLREAEQQIDEQLGGDAAAHDLCGELARGELATWEHELGLVQAAIADREQAIEDVRSLLQERRSRREALEASADVPAKAGRVAALEAELQEAVRRWREAALLERVLHQTLERFQQERQPAVFRNASESFRRITAGRWTTIRQVADAPEVEVVDAQGRAVAPRDLSRGTIDQLYFSVRLGLVRAFAEQGRRLPLLLDDVLVNFDPTRADAAAEVIGGFADQGQVLLFTCHPQTLERLVRVRPDCRVVDLEEARKGASAVA